VVVNESILAGTPVVTSDQVGASAIVTAWHCGAVFRSQDVDALKDTLAAFLRDSSRLAHARAATRAAAAAISPEHAGLYLHEIMSGRTVPPPFLPAAS
jgi:glycosyltransferase involved in cell wall biosynthesis